MDCVHERPKSRESSNKCVVSDLKRLDEGDLG